MSRILQGVRSFQTTYNFINAQILYEYIRFYKYDECVSLTDFSFSLLAAGGHSSAISKSNRSGTYAQGLVRYHPGHKVQKMRARLIKEWKHKINFKRASYVRIMLHFNKLSISTVSQIILLTNEYSKSCKMFKPKLFSFFAKASLSEKYFF